MTRREFLALAGSGVLGVAACTPRSTLAGNGRSEMRLYVGTYTRGRSEGIYRLRMDPDTGALRTEGVVKGVANPSFLTLDRTGRHLYSVEELEEFRGEKAGAVTAFSVQADGDLRPLGQCSSRGGAPCHVTVEAGTRFVLVANYLGGNAAVLPILADGSLGEAVAVAQHQGRGANPERQEAPHVHSVTMDAANRFAFVADLGIDQVVVYRFDAASGALTPAEPARLAPGSGPRHFAFHPDGRRAYVINELSSTLTAFSYDAQTGRLSETQTISTLPAGFQGSNSTADLHVAPSGRFVYGSNRGHDSIVVYAVAPDGALSLVQHQSTLGRTPRNFTLDPSGRFLLATNQNSDSVAVFSVDAGSGRLTPTGVVHDVPVPVCLRFA